MTLPVAFERNRGQFDDHVAYRARAGGGTVTIGKEGSISVSGSGSRFGLAGSRRVEPMGVDQLTARARYFRGNNPDRWIRDVPLHRAVRLANVYPGIDWVWKAGDQGIEYDFIVRPGANPRYIQLRFSSSATLRIVDGDLHVTDRGVETVHQRPEAFQTTDGRTRHIDARWRIRGSRARFEVGPYDRRLPLIVDPVLSWSTHVGTGAVDRITDVAIGAGGSIFVAGETLASPPNLNTQDAFIAKLTSAGELVFITHFGGSSTEFGPKIAVAGDQVYLAGGTQSNDFPVVAPAQPNSGGERDGYAGLLRADGGFAFSTYLGGSSVDFFGDVAIAADGTAWLTGTTWSTDWPTVSAMNATFGGGTDGLLAHFSPSGQLLTSSYVGGTFCESFNTLAVAADGAVYLAGSIASYPPGPPPPPQGPCQPPSTGWLVKLRPGGTSIHWSQGPLGTETFLDIAALNDTVWATGVARTATLTRTPDAYDSSCGSDGACNGVSDGFLIVRNSDGSPVYASYIGGNAFEQELALTGDWSGGVWVVGTTGSTDWPEAGSSVDVFALRFEATTRVVNYAVRFGGTGSDNAIAVAADARGAYVAGTTASPTLPAERNTLAGAADGFLAHFASLAKTVFIDHPVNDARVLPELQIDGWAIDDRAASGTGIDAIHMWAFSLDDPAAPPHFLGVGQHGLARPDVAAAFGARYGSSGYRLAASLPGFGRYLIGVYGRSTTTMQFDAVRTVIVTAADLARITIDNPPQGAQVTPPLVVAGWALNPEASSGQGTGVDGVDVWAFPAGGAPPVFVGAAFYGLDRPDVAAQFGAQFRHSGYQVTTSHLWPGSYALAAYPHYAGSNRYGSPAVTPIQIAPGPHVWIDQPVGSTTIGQPITISGWALDRRAPSGTGIDHVLVYANRLDDPSGTGTLTFIGAADWGLPRPDVANVFGAQFIDCGFRLTVSGLTPGFYRLAVYAHGVNAPPGSFPYFETWTGIITVQ